MILFRHIHRCLLGGTILSTALLPAGAAFAQVAAQAPATADAPGAPQTEIIVTGTRRSDRTIADSPVPIDVIGGDQLKNSGYTETNKVLNDLVPSFNFPQPSITDGTDALRPATLRGLAPDQTLVLVNGKRRHTSALLNINGSVGRGSAAVDLNTIPPLAIERIEVLRDGASSQYGSDAIAGVINIRLKRSQGGRATATYGEYHTTLAGVPNVTGVQAAGGVPVPNPQAGAANVYALTSDGERKRRDGAQTTLAANVGLPMGDQGYLNVTLQWQDRNPTDRSGADPRQQYFAGDPRELTINRYTHRYGDARTNDLIAFVNAGTTLAGGTEVYGFGSYNIRDGESAGFYRRANDARNRDFAASTTTFVPVYADGFLPLITSQIEDYAFAGGIRGELSDWKYDLSLVHGHNSFQFGVQNSVNTSIGGTGPRVFDAGGLRFGQTTGNLDVQHTIAGIGDGLSIALGAEIRRERFQIVPGDVASYVAGPFAAKPFNAAAGAQVFPGFRPANATDASRTAYAAYAEAETKLASIFTVQAAGRYEHFSDFGDTVNGKLAAKLDPFRGLGLRGSVSTGFRAPSLHQQYYSTSSTNNVNGTLVEIGTFAVSDPVAVSLGSRPLRPEKAVNYSAGATFTMIPGLSVTADYYNIRIKDRIIITENLQGAGVVGVLQGAGFNNITSARFFINGVTTRTQGLDIVAAYTLRDFGIGRFRFNAGYNHNVTKITARNTLPNNLGLTLFGRQESLRLTDGQPRDKINVGVDYDYGPVGATVRANRFGTVLVPGVDEARDQVLSAKWVTDAELRIKPYKQIELAVGANNVFDIYPDVVRAGIVNGQNYGLNGYFIPYSQFSPFGFNGRYLYGRVSIGF